MSTLIDKANEILDEKEAKIIPENIKSGVTIFDVEGTYGGGGDDPTKLVFKQGDKIYLAMEQLQTDVHQAALAAHKGSELVLSNLNGTTPVKSVILFKNTSETNACCLYVSLHDGAAHLLAEIETNNTTNTFYLARLCTVSGPTVSAEYVPLSARQHDGITPATTYICADNYFGEDNIFEIDLTCKGILNLADNTTIEFNQVFWDYQSQTFTDQLCIAKNGNLPSITLNTHDNIWIDFYSISDYISGVLPQYVREHKIYAEGSDTDELTFEIAYSMDDNAGIGFKVDTEQLLLKVYKFSDTRKESSIWTYESYIQLHGIEPSSFDEPVSDWTVADLIMFLTACAQYNPFEYIGSNITLSYPRIIIYSADVYNNKYELPLPFQYIYIKNSAE